MGDTSIYELVNPFDSDAINNIENVENIEIVDENNGNEEIFSVSYIFFVIVIFKMLH